MSRGERTARIDAGMRVADEPVHDQDRTWSRHSSDKPDIGRALAAVARRVMLGLPPTTPLRCLGIGSSSEPQLRVMHALCAGGVTLLDVAPEGLHAVEARARRQGLGDVTTVHGDYARSFESKDSAKAFRAAHLAGNRAHLIALHHSLYYTPADTWSSLVANLHEEVLSRPGALHAVMMSADAPGEDTTTRLYARFAVRFHGRRNDQSLPRLARGLRRTAGVAASEIRCRSTEVRFFTDDFERFMAVVWMILLYPQVHDYTDAQKRQITEHVHDAFFEPRRPLVQVQDHLTIVRGRG